MVKAAAVPNLDDVASFAVAGKAGDFVYHEGDAGSDMYIIQDGRVELLDEATGKPRQRALLDPGDFFGELSLLEDRPRDFSARGVTDYRLLRIDRTTLQQLVQENPEIAIRMLHRLASRLREHEDARLKALEIAAGAMHPLPRLGVVADPVAADVSAARAAAPVAEAHLGNEAPAAQPASAAASAVTPKTGRLIHGASGREFALDSDRELIVGRIDRATGFTPDVDLTACDPQRSLSRRHAFVTSADGRFYLCEQAPTRNGTYVNGARIVAGAKVELHDDDQVRFGLVETVFTSR